MQDASKTYGCNKPVMATESGCAGIWRTLRLLAFASVTGSAAIESAAWAGAEGAEHTAETMIRMYPAAVVTSDDVTLADVAEIKGDSADLIKTWKIVASPHVGDSGAIDLAHLQSVLSRRGANLSQWVFRGSSRCVVTRVAGRNATDKSSPPNLLTTSQPANATDEPAKVEVRTLEAALRAHVAKRLAAVGGVPLIRFSPAMAKLLALSKPHFDFELSDRSERLLGMVPIEAVILEDGKIKQTVPILAEVSLRQAVVVAVRPINRGEIIEAGALAMQERIFTKPEDIGLTQKQPLIGQRVKRFIDEKEIVYARDIEPVPLVLRNDLVTVMIRRGGLMIRGSAKALSSGSLGENVLLKNEASKETFTAMVTAQKTAEVRDQGVSHAVVEAVAKGD